MNVGLLEDNAAISECITIALEMAGHTVSRYTAGLPLLQKVLPASAGTPPVYDMLIIDLNLPGSMSGQEVVLKLRSTPSTKDLPIIIISATHEKELAQLRALLPSVSVLRKPFELQELVRCVGQYMQV